MRIRVVVEILKSVKESSASNPGRLFLPLMNTIAVHATFLNIRAHEHPRGGCACRRRVHRLPVDIDIIVGPTT